MNRTEIFEQLKEAYQTVLGKELDDSISESSRLREDMALSSVGMLYFVIVLENLFDVRFDGVGMETFVTVADVIDFIEQKQVK